MQQQWRRAPSIGSSDYSHYTQPLPMKLDKEVMGSDFGYDTTQAPAATPRKKPPKLASKPAPSNGRDTSNLDDAHRIPSMKCFQTMKLMWQERASLTEMIIEFQLTVLCPLIQLRDCAVLRHFKTTAEEAQRPLRATAWQTKRGRERSQCPLCAHITIRTCRAKTR